VVRSLAAAGTGVLLIDHNIRLIMAVCDLIHVVVQGKSFLEGTPAEVQGSEALAEAYLGRSGRVHDAA
jgi:ABC-type branched-subunit amino acid transport system ATPase component